MKAPSFDLLDPQEVLRNVETAYALRLDGTINPFRSYVNRVYGFKDEDGAEFVAKFYRPGRWSPEALLEEHRFVLDCAEAELPVVAPLPNEKGETLSALELPEGAGTLSFALYPKKSGRSFDAEGQEDWLRLGRLLARLHLVGKKRDAPHRLRCTPQDSSLVFLQELWDSGIVHEGVRDEFFDLCEEVLDALNPSFAGLDFQRIHGDCHRGNILDRGEEGLLLIDFDDTMTGPPVQDFWLLLPDHAQNCPKEINLLLEGYEEFTPFDYRSLELIEALRFMRMLYFLAWCFRQRLDLGFSRAFPDWGSKSFWVKELEDFRNQAGWLGAL